MGTSGVSRRDVESLGRWGVWGQVGAAGACGLRRRLKVLGAVVGYLIPKG